MVVVVWLIGIIVGIVRSLLPWARSWLNDVEGRVLLPVHEIAWTVVHDGRVGKGMICG